MDAQEGVGAGATCGMTATPVSHELVKSAYERCCDAYETAVEVTKFTWKMFYTREAAVLTAAGYIALNDPQAAVISAVLLGLSAPMTLWMTWPQMVANHRVIRKVIAAGLFLEREHPDLGCRFKIDAFGDRLSDTQQLRELWQGPEPLLTRSLSDIAITPQFGRYCLILMSADVILCVVSLLQWIGALNGTPPFGRTVAGA